jgi:dTDP-4-dehydrorhamnose 3,5-epimerase
VIFTPLSLQGAYLIELEPKTDNRGFFARTWCAREFQEHGLSADFVQFNVSYNAKRGVLRGMHYQAPPHDETKVIRCTMGAIYDVIVDVRRASPTYKQWLSVELTAQNRRSLYVPGGFAHGFQTLADDSEVFYQMSAYFEPESARGIRWDDPAFAFAWPIDNPILNEADAKRQSWQDNSAI